MHLKVYHCCFLNVFFFHSITSFLLTFLFSASKKLLGEAFCVFFFLFFFKRGEIFCMKDCCYKSPNWSYSKVTPTQLFY